MAEARIIHRALWLAALIMGLSAPAAVAQPGARTDYCAHGERTSLFLVDRTTRFDATDEQILIGQVEAFYRAQAPGERVLLVALSGDYTTMRVAFNECRPGCPAESFMTRLVSACRPIIARTDFLAWEGRFIAALRDLLRNQEDAPNSDLFRTVQEATRMVQGNGYPPLRQFLFYSDLLEASVLFGGRAWRQLPARDILQRLERERITASLAGATVRVVGFGRDDAPGRAALPPAVRQRIEDAWRGWFTAGGAGNVQIGLR